MFQINSDKILPLLIFSIIYVILQQIKRVLVRELDTDIYNTIIEYILLFEYSMVIVGLMIFGNFSSGNIVVGFTSSLILRYSYNKLLYSRFYKTMVKKIKRNNIHNK